MGNTEEDRCAEARKFQRIDEAFRVGDLDALHAAVDDPESVPNGPMPLTIGPCLVYAIYHSPLSFIRTLLEIGADPNLSDNDGFPPLIAALSKSRSQPGSLARPDVTEVVKLLLEFHADPNQRGHNDYTPLHMAVCERNRDAIAVLLTYGADPTRRTRIDDYLTPREMAEETGQMEIAALLLRHEHAINQPEK